MLSESKFYHVIRIKILPCNPFQKSYHVIRVESNRTVSHLVAVSANRKVDPQAERKKLYFIFIRSYLFEDFFYCFTKLPGDHDSRHDPVNFSICCLPHQSFINKHLRHILNWNLFLNATNQLRQRIKTNCK